MHLVKFFFESIGHRGKGFLLLYETGGQNSTEDLRSSFTRHFLKSPARHSRMKKDYFWNGKG